MYPNLVISLCCNILCFVADFFCRIVSHLYFWDCVNCGLYHHVSPIERSTSRCPPFAGAGPSRAMNAADFAPLRNAGRFCRAAALLLVQFYEIQDSLMNGRWVDGFNIF